MKLLKKEIESRIKSSSLYFPFISITDIPFPISKTLSSRLDSFVILPKNTEFNIFKSSGVNEYSLTCNGFFAVICSKLFNSIYTTKLSKEEISTCNTLLTLNKMFESPYLILDCDVYYFDDIIHAQQNIYGSFSNLIRAYKN